MPRKDEKNARRFAGFADIYDSARPALPLCAIELACLYLGKTPGLVVDMGCGTGLSTFAWASHCASVVGVEPSPDMLGIARAKQQEGVSFVQAFSHDTGLETASADVVICSQSFHWMEPTSTLTEISRILAPGGVFATVDCDWPPMCGTEAELAYARLFEAVARAETETPALRDASTKWSKDNHLKNIRQSGYFRYAREAVFDTVMDCTADRLIGIAFSQGGLQAALKACPEQLLPEADRYCEAIRRVFGDKTFSVSFGYRMRIGVK